MNQRVRLTEGDIQNMIRERVNKAFTLSDSKIVDSLKQIISSCNDIYYNCQPLTSEEAPCVTVGEVEVSKWAKKVRQEAEEILKIAVR